VTTLVNRKHSVYIKEEIDITEEHKDKKALELLSRQAIDGDFE